MKILKAKPNLKIQIVDEMAVVSTTGYPIDTMHIYADILLPSTSPELFKEFEW